MPEDFTTLQQFYPDITIFVSPNGDTVTIKNLPPIYNGLDGIYTTKDWIVLSYKENTVVFQGPESSEHASISDNFLFDL
jgi:hypothetical protein